MQSPQRKPQYDWSALKSDENLQLTYSVTVKKRSAALCEDTQSATEKCEKLIQSNEEASAKLIPKKSRKSRRKLSEDPRLDTVR